MRLRSPRLGNYAVLLPISTLLHTSNLSIRIVNGSRELVRLDEARLELAAGNQLA
jgi:hypothetical protein